MRASGILAASQPLPTQAYDEIAIEDLAGRWQSKGLLITPPVNTTCMSPPWRMC
jgi:hypothetical protein